MFESVDGHLTGDGGEVVEGLAALNVIQQRLKRNAGSPETRRAPKNIWVLLR